MKIEICKEESINGRWKWRVLEEDGTFWNESKKGITWIASQEGVQAMEEIRNALQILSNAIATSKD